MDIPYHTVTEYFDENKKLINKREGACFSTSFANSFINPEFKPTPKYIRYIPSIRRWGLKQEQYDNYIAFVASLPVFTPMCNGYTPNQIWKGGVFIDIDVWSAWHIFGFWTAIRVVDEAEMLIRMFEYYCNFMTPIQAFVFAHKMPLFREWNQQHLLINENAVDLDENVYERMSKNFPTKLSPLRNKTYTYASNIGLHSTFKLPNLDAKNCPNYGASFNDWLVACFPKTHERMLEYVKNNPFGTESPIPTFPI